MKTGTLTAEDVKKLLGLAPHPREGGWYVRTYEARELVTAMTVLPRGLAARRAGPATPSMARRNRSVTFFRRTQERSPAPARAARRWRSSRAR